MKPEILQIAPMPPRIEAALDAAYVVHRYFAAEDRDALLAAHGPAIRAVATDGHFGIAPEVLATLPRSRSSPATASATTRSIPPPAAPAGFASPTRPTC